MTKRHLIATLFASSMLSGSLTTPLLAQNGTSSPTTIPVAEVYRTVDEFGIDLATGALNLSVEDVSAGNSEGALVHKRYWVSGNTWRDEFDYTLTVASNITVALGRKQ